MLKIFFHLCLIYILIFALLPPNARADEYLFYQDLIHLGKEAIHQRLYEKAILYFKLAHLLDPSKEEPRFYVNLIHRIQQGRVHFVEPLIPVQPSSRENAIEEAFKRLQQNPIISYLHPISPLPLIELPSNKQNFKSPDSVCRASGRFKVGKEKLNKAQPTSVHELTSAANEVMVINDELRAQQSKTFLKVELNKAIIMEGQNIDRFLIVTPGFIDVERIDRNRIKIIGKNRGTTFLHVWDDQARWTFQVEVIFPILKESLTAVQQIVSQESVEPFKFIYTSNWNSYYTGNGLRGLQRQNLNFLQYTGIAGDTPYGHLDTSAIFNKFNESTQVTAYTIGLTQADIWALPNFNVRGFDLAKRFSELSLPGKYLRGALLEGEALDRNLGYTLVWGRDRSTYGFLGPGILEKRESYIDGARLHFFPHSDHQYALNYAQGYGSARESFLKDRVFSVETRQKFPLPHSLKNFLGNGVDLSSEVAFDQERFAKTFSTGLGDDKFQLNLNFRDLDKDFETISGAPPNRGEIGGIINLNWNLENWNVSSNLDVFKDRFLFNPDRPDALNLDWNSSFDVSLKDFADYRTYMTFVDTPGEISPRRNGQITNTYSKTFYPLKNYPISTFVGNSYQRNRYKFSAISEFDRYAMNAGMRFPLPYHLSYFVNYEHSWVHETLSDDHLTPSVLTTGLSFYKKLSDFWSGNLSYSYRDEENTQGLHSFLSGEDSTTGTIGLNFRPSPDFEFFVDGQLRNVWPENNTRTAYNEGEVRWGVRSSWDLPFRFNPQGEIKGMVYKDLNGNGRQDYEETGVPGIRMKIGNQQTKTNAKGEYSVQVRAKKVVVEVDADSIPQGYISTTPLFETVNVLNNRAQILNFGLTIHSGIYGVVFYDKNQNGKPDPEDVFISKVRIILDEQETAFSDYEGSYFFNDVSAGMHTIRLDVNSLPIEYIPLVKIKNEFELFEGKTYIFHIPLKKKE